MSKFSLGYCGMNYRKTFQQALKIKEMLVDSLKDTPFESIEIKIIPSDELLALRDKVRKYEEKLGIKSHNIIIDEEIDV